LRTLISHTAAFLPLSRTPLAHVLAVVLTDLRVGAIASARSLEPSLIARITALLAAVDLAAIVDGADVRDPRTPPTPEFSEAVGREHRAPTRAQEKT
jgi:hypothetical protein